MRVIDEGQAPGERWRVVQRPEGDYALEQVFTPANPALPRSWRVTPLAQQEIWDKYPSEAPLSYRPYPREPAPWWYRLFWGVDSR